jgi:hypothetical protein
LTLPNAIFHPTLRRNDPWLTVPNDPASKGRPESGVKLAKAGLVSTDANLLDEYASLAALDEQLAATRDLCDATRSCRCTAWALEGSSAP